MQADNVTPLRPARPAEEEDAEAFRKWSPRRWILGASALLVVLGAVYIGRSMYRENSLREQIDELYAQQVEPTASTIRDLQANIERWTAEAARKSPAEPQVSAELSVDALRKGQAAYLRIKQSQASDAAGIAVGAQAMGRDAIFSCLGVPPTSVRRLYDGGSVAAAGWLERVAHTDGDMQLRVQQARLERYITRDRAPLLNLAASRYFFLILEKGDRRKDPVSVHIWNVQSGDKLFAATIQPEGKLLAARVAMGDTKPGRTTKPPKASSSAADCDIATQVRELMRD